MSQNEDWARVFYIKPNAWKMEQELANYLFCFKKKKGEEKQRLVSILLFFFQDYQNDYCLKIKKISMEYFIGV